MSDQSSVIYRPLSVDERQIRVLTVKPDLQDDNICCNLEIISLGNESCQYDAVSWCWGDPTQQSQVIVDGQLVYVPANAEKVLRKVVLHHGYTRIWIDAICINQSDLEERASQVSIMRQVYSQAANVLVWLGDDEGFALAALQSVNELVEHCRASTNNLANYENPGWMRSKSRTPRRWFSYEPLPGGIDWPAIRHLYSSPLLCRVWIIQEISLAKIPTCFYGPSRVHWKDIGIAAEWMLHRSYERSEYCGVFVRGITNAAIICDTRRSMRQLDKLLMTSGSFDCSDPRDKVFGLLGLTEQTGQDAVIRPDYKKPVRDIFITATRTAISASQRLHILASARITSSDHVHLVREDPMPSWVLAYATPWKRGPKGIRNFSERGAGNDLPMAWDGGGCVDMLRVQGLAVVDIVTVFKPLDLELLSSRTLMARMVEEMITLITGLDPAAVVGKVLYEAFTTNSIGNSPVRGERYLSYSQFEAFLQECQQQQLPTEAEHEFSDASAILLDHLKITALRRSFFITADGQAGQSSSLPAKGDRICIVFGSDIPLILRPAGDQFHLVGDAYLADIMDGSYVANLQHEDNLAETSRWFDIV